MRRGSERRGAVGQFSFLFPLALNSPVFHFGTCRHVSQNSKTDSKQDRPGENSRNKGKRKVDVVDVHL